MREFLFGNLRVQLLTSDIVRLEYAKRGKFCNKPTLICSDREKFKDKVEYKTFGSYIIFGGYTLSIPDGARSLSGVKLLKDGVAVYTYKKNSDNLLPPAQKTPEVFALADNPRIIVPDGGYKYRGKIISSGFKCEQNVQDVYLLICGGDCKKLTKLYRTLTGGGEMPRLQSFGKWTECDLAEANILLKNSAQNVIVRGVHNKDKDALSELKKACAAAQKCGVEVAVRYSKNTDDVFNPAEVKERDAEINAYLRSGVTTLITEGCSDTEKYAALQTVKNFYKKSAGELSPLRAQCFDSVKECGYGKLLPYLYCLEYENYTLGEPVKKQLGREYVTDKRAAKAENEYITGNNILTSDGSETYLPAGKWLSENSGKIYAGGKTVAETGNFIRLGAILPLSENTKWDKLTYEFYPSKTAEDSGYIYEDDGVSEVYMQGKARKCAYKAFFDPYINAYKVELSAAKGQYKDFSEREILFKFYTLAGAGTVNKITVNGADIVYEKTAKIENSPAASLSFTVKAALNKDYLIIFYL